ncbi:actin-binding protein IPP-like isoform X2 [Drosophila novamexicana]|uniref:actin-binding protein IPP-like isoform X2 n=1 Tax=Drosophila novamexicana TaxID=47314 RepID=UPI0011E5C45B|nr:actin-binding protein IPP-like isoform X2 [Drosophila novamexicana]
MEDSFIIKDLSEGLSDTESSDDTARCTPSNLEKSFTTETSATPRLEILWDGQSDLSAAEQRKQSLDNSHRLKSGAQLEEKSSDSTRTYTDTKTELGDETVSQINSNPTSAPTFDNKEASASSDLDEKLGLPLVWYEKQELNEDSKEGSSVKSYRSQMERPLTQSEEQLLVVPLDETYSLMDKIDLKAEMNNGNEQQPGRPHIGERLLQLLLDGNNWDVKVYIGDYKFYCHLCVLQVYSPYFQRCKMEQTYVIRLPTHKVTAQAFHIIYNWMLHDEPPPRKRFSNRCLLEIYSSAKFLAITELIDAVWNTLDIIKNENEAFTLLPDMNYVDMATFDFLCFSRISRFFLTLVASLEFAEMDASYVCRLLSSHSVGVNSEIEIFYSALRWLSYKWPKRRTHVPQLMGCVRFGLLSPVFLRFLQKEHSTRVMDYITKCPQVQELINKAFVYASAELYCKDPQQTLPFQLPEYVVPEQRRWLYDDKCPYHHDLKCSQRQFFTYEQFLTYLQTLHETGPEYWRNLIYILEPIKCCARPSPD